jgi:hypothetical protein
VGDPIAPAVARHPAEAVLLVSLAVSDGDLEAALAQYERGAVLRPWARDPAPEASAVAEDGDVACWLRQLMELRLPLSVTVRAVLPAAGIALVLAGRQMAGLDPDCERVELGGLGATVVRCQPGGCWRIAADAWQLAGAGGGAPG